MEHQEEMAFAIVGGISLLLFLRLYRAYCALPLAQFFLKHGCVKIAMHLKKHAIKKSGCSGCDK